MKSLFAKIIVLMCFGLLALASSAEDVLPRIVLDEVPVSFAIKNLARQANINYIIDPRVLSDNTLPVITETWEKTTAKEALSKVLDERNLVMVENPVTSVARIVPKGVAIQPVPKTWLGTDTNTVIPLIVMNDVPYEDAVSNLAKQMHLEKISADKESPRNSEGQPVKVTVRWEKLTAKQALVALLDNYNLVLIMDTKTPTARIIPNNKAAQSNSP